MADRAPLPDADAPDRVVRVRASLPSASRRSRLAPVLSFVVHALLILLAIRLTAAVALPERSPIGDAIQMVLGGGGGGGHQGAQFEHPPPPPEPTKPVPQPVPTVIPPPQPVQETVPPPSIQPAPLPAAPGDAGTGTGTGGGTGSGQGIGNGSGKGPGSGSGTGGGNDSSAGPSRPDPKQLIIPPLDSPKQLRGKTVQVTFTVGADGKVIDVAVAPPIGNRGYAKRFDEAMRDYQFHPARDAAGKAVQGMVTITVTFSSI